MSPLIIQYNLIRPMQTPFYSFAPAPRLWTLTPMSSIPSTRRYNSLILKPKVVRRRSLSSNQFYSVLQQEYDHTVTDLRRKKSLLSPIRRLPSDILLHIFGLATDDGEYCLSSPPFIFSQRLLYMEGHRAIIADPFLQRESHHK